MLKVYLYGYLTLLKKETIRICRIWPQTILPPAITISLYFLIFGHLIGRHLQGVFHVSYSAYIAPGLVIMPIISNAYVNVSGSFYSARFMRSIEEVMVSPMPMGWMMLSYVTGGIMRAGMVGLVSLIIALFFIPMHIAHLPLLILTFFLTAMIFSLLGFINGMFAKRFDDVSIIPTFVLTPLTYLGGVFYPISALPDFWRQLAHLNPIAYVVDLFRYSLIGTAQVNITDALIAMLIFTMVLFVVTYQLVSRGIGIRA